LRAGTCRSIGRSCETRDIRANRPDKLVRSVDAAFRIAVNVISISNGLDQNVSKAKFGILFTALLFLLAAGSQAMARSESFRRTCQDIHVSATSTGQLITAQCAGPASPCPFLTSCFGATNATQLLVPPEGCEDISNRNGSLVCVHTSSFLVPGGSWSASCSGGRFIQGPMFDAVCKTGLGEQTQVSRIDMSKCPKNRVENIRGQLRCQ
jgi:hypothetical protein